MATTQTVTRNDFLSYCKLIDPEFHRIIGILLYHSGIEVYLSGGTLTIFTLNQLKAKEIPIEYVEDIDIFVKASGPTQEDLARIFVIDYSFYVDSDKRYARYKSDRRQFTNLKSKDNNINIIISEDNLETTLEDFDLNCNQVGLDLTNNCFCYSNTFIDFLDNEILKFHRSRVRPNSLGRMLYKVSQYKLDKDSVDENEIIFIFNHFNDLDKLFFNLSKKNSKELKLKLVDVVKPFSYLFEDFAITEDGLADFVLSPDITTNVRSNLNENLLFYRSKEIGF